MQPVNFRSFKQKLRHRKKTYTRFLKKIDKQPPVHLDAMAKEISKEVWKDIDCLTCANCCKTMTPTFTNKDIKNIAVHFEMTNTEVKEKWLQYDKKDGDWTNVKQPCQFLHAETNMCAIYEIRPNDCADFPHIARKSMKDYIYIQQQNINYCPASFSMVEKMIEKMKPINP